MARHQSPQLGFVSTDDDYSSDDSEVAVVNTRELLQASAKRKKVHDSYEKIQQHPAKKPKLEAAIESPQLSTTKFAENARKFTLTDYLWFTSSVWQLEVDSHYKEKDRFKNEWNKRQGILLELRKAIPASLLHKLPSLEKEWKQVTAVIRHATAYKIWTKFSKLIFGEDLADLSPTKRLEKFKNQIGYNKTIKIYDSFAPILYSKGDEGLIHRVFRADVLFKVAKTLLFNHPSSIPDDGRAPYATKWALKEVTPGLIAAAAILTRWALSADEKCQRIGPQTKIDYTRDFAEYKQYLLVGLMNKNGSVASLFQLWNEEMFPPATSSRYYGGSTDEQQSDGFKRAIGALRAEIAREKERAGGSRSGKRRKHTEKSRKRRTI